MSRKLNTHLFVVYFSNMACEAKILEKLRPEAEENFIEPCCEVSTAEFQPISLPSLRILSRLPTRIGSLGLKFDEHNCEVLAAALPAFVAAASDFSWRLVEEYNRGATREMWQNKNWLFSLSTLCQYLILHMDSLSPVYRACPFFTGKKTSLTMTKNWFWKSWFSDILLLLLNNLAFTFRGWYRNCKSCFVVVGCNVHRIVAKVGCMYHHCTIHSRK